MRFVAKLRAIAIAVPSCAFWISSAAAQVSPSYRITQLTFDTFGHRAPSINAQGDIVWTGSDNLLPGQIGGNCPPYLLQHGMTAPTQINVPGNQIDNCYAVIDDTNGIWYMRRGKLIVNRDGVETVVQSPSDNQSFDQEWGVSSNGTAIYAYDICNPQCAQRRLAINGKDLLRNFDGHWPTINNQLVIVYFNEQGFVKSTAAAPNQLTVIDAYIDAFPARMGNGTNPQVVYEKFGQVMSKFGDALPVAVHSGFFPAVNDAGAIVFEDVVSGVAQIFVATPAVERLDPVSTLLANGKLTTNIEVLAKQGRSVKGVATDGVARLVLRFSAPQAGTATFSLVDSDGTPLNANDENGQLQDRLGLQTGNSVTAATEGPDNKVFAVFIAPSQFVRTGKPADQSAPQRQIFVHVQFTPNGGKPSDAGNTPVTLIRPLVFLVHGVWSSSATWENFGVFGNGVADPRPRFFVRKADYETIADRDFQTIAPSVFTQLKGYLIVYARKNDVAAIQADVVAHSMGAPVIRTIARRADYLNDPSFFTFGKGAIRKLITFGGVNKGSPLANYLSATPCLNKLFILLDKNPNGGAVSDMREDSSAIAAINSAQSLFPVHTIIGITDQHGKSIVQSIQSGAK